MQRLRLRFSRGEEVKYISHLDLMRLWERAFRRSRTPLTYSEGFSPHAKLSIAAPLPIGVTSDIELMDVLLHMPLSPYLLMQNMSRVLPCGIDLLEVQQIPLSDPSLQSQMRFAEYNVGVKTYMGLEEVQALITTLLQLQSLPWQHMRDTGPRRYDLRALVKHLWIVNQQGEIFTIGMRLCCDSRGTGRPEQVTQAIGFVDTPCSIHRTRLILA